MTKKVKLCPLVWFSTVVGYEAQMCEEIGFNFGAQILSSKTTAASSHIQKYPHISSSQSILMIDIHLHVNIGRSEHSNGEEVADKADGHHRRHQETLVQIFGKKKKIRETWCKYLVKKIREP